jgi:hypothetical protein
MSTTRPKQRLKKSEKDKNWVEDNINYWCGRADTQPMFVEDSIKLYAAAAGKLDESLYTYVTNPLNTERDNLKGYPAKMRNIDILSPNISLLMGELNNRFFNPTVVAINGELNNDAEKLEHNLIVQQMQEIFIQSLVEKGLLPEEIAETPLPQEIINKQVSSLKDQLAMMGQQAIDVIMKDNEVDLVRRKTLYDFIVCSRMFTYRDVNRGNLIYEHVSPFELRFVNNPRLNFIEDSEAVKRQNTLQLSELVDMFWDDKDFQDILPELELKSASMGDAMQYQGFVTAGFREDFNDDYNLGVEGFVLEHVNWTSLRLMKRVSGISEDGTPYVKDFDEDYIPLPSEEVEEYWVNQDWEGYRIDGKYCIAGAPIPFKVGTYDNPSSTKKLYNGRIFNNSYIIPQSIIEKGLVYQIKYNIVHYHLEKTLAKNKDKLTVFPLGVIPQKEGWDEFTLMYYADAHGYLFLDETNPQSMAALQYIKSIDMSMSAYIKDMYAILQQIKMDWDETVGISRQRKGQNMASDGKAVTEEAVYRSSVISEEFFKQHEETIVRDLQCLMDLSKIAWVNGKRGTYQKSDYSIVHYNLDPEVYPFGMYGVFVENSTHATKALEMMKAQIGTVAQQTQNMGMLPRIAQATNMQKLIEQIDEIEAQLQQREAQQQEAQNAIEEAKLADKEADRQLEIYKIDETNATKIDVALIQYQANIMSYQEGDNSGEAAKLEEMYIKRAEVEAKKMEMINKINLEREKISNDRKARQDEKALKNKELDIKKEEQKVTRENMVNDKEIALIQARSKNKKS